MKLSRHYRDVGADVLLYDPLFSHTYDKILASKIFLDSDDSLLDPAQMEIGGSGWNLKTNLPDEIEKLPPDYSLYGYPHNIGFTMRGCRFRCDFCIVPKKEGRPKSNSTILDMWQQRDSDFVMLLDNDFFGNPDWADRIKEIKENNLRVSFSQGLNIRIITDEQCAALASVRFRNIKGTKKQVYFAWDRVRDERLILRGIDRVIAAGIKHYQMAFFVLIGFDTTPAEDLARVQLLSGLGCDPYVMPYKKTDPYQHSFARWANHKAIFKSVSWPEYQDGVKRRTIDEMQLELLGVEAL